MAGKRRPMDVNLAVVKGGGGKHWTKAEIEERQHSEVKAGKPRSLTPPKWLSKPAAKLFRAYAKELLALPGDVVSKLDTGTLARYCDCEATYGEASRHKEIWMAQLSAQIPDVSGGGEIATQDEIHEREKEYSEAQAQLDYWTGQMAKMEKICRGCATELGMTVSSRCRLVVPKVEEAPENPIEELRRRFQA